MDFFYSNQNANDYFTLILLGFSFSFLSCIGDLYIDQHRIFPRCLKEACLELIYGISWASWAQFVFLLMCPDNKFSILIYTLGQFIPILLFSNDIVDSILGSTSFQIGKLLFVFFFFDSKKTKYR